MSEKVICPGCGVPFPKTGDAASHMYQKQGSEHPWDSYESALEAVESESENRKTAEGSNDDEPDDPPGSGVARGGGGGDPENPILRHPPTRSVSSDPCPSCGSELLPIGAGLQFEGILQDESKGKKTVQGRTDDGDKHCPDCGILVGTRGGVVANAV